MYLVDTNVTLELLLDQERSDDVRTFLRTVDSSLIYITPEFSVYSIGIALLRMEKTELFMRWITDLLNSNVRIAKLDLPDYKILVSTAQRFKLDFDDAYHYAAAEKYNLEIVSFDTDFDGTERGRKTPDEIVD
jgi:predicted nucleic acid-binding protein